MNDIKGTSRIMFLEASVTIEDMLSLLLSILLGIKKSNESKSLGTKSTALSFNAKFNLLLDMEYIEKENTWKFQMFMEMRNQFAHNLKASTFEKCFQFVKGRDKLLSLYPHDKSLSLEERLRNVSMDLVFEVIHLCKKSVQKISEKYRTEKVLETMSAMSIAVFMTIKKIKNDLLAKEESNELFAEFLKSISSEVTKINKANPEEKDAMLKEFLDKQDFPNIFKTSSLPDFFSNQEPATIENRKGMNNTSIKSG